MYNTVLFELVNLYYIRVLSAKTRFTPSSRLYAALSINLMMPDQLHNRSRLEKMQLFKILISDLFGLLGDLNHGEYFRN